VVFPTAVSSSKLYLAAIKFGFIGVERYRWLLEEEDLAPGDPKIAARLSAYRCAAERRSPLGLPGFPGRGGRGLKEGAP